MAAVISGNGLGLFNSSFTQLGGASGGSGGIGQSGSRHYVNLANGNLILQDLDESILTRGLPVGFMRTYNSRGQVTEAGRQVQVGQDGWLNVFERRIGNLTGTLNTAGSTVTRTLGDGSEVVYAWDAAYNAYVSTVGDGTHDIIGWNQTTSQWTWSDLERRINEYHDASGRLVAIGNSLTGASYALTWDPNGRLFSVLSDANGTTTGDGLFFGYDANGRLACLATRGNGTIQGQVWYAYDSYGRLSSVTTDLRPDAATIDTVNFTVTMSPASGNTWDDVTRSNNNGLLFRTSYEYMSASASDLRVRTVRYGDGTLLNVDYDGNGRITRTTLGDTNGNDADGLGQTTSYSYGTTSGGLTPVTVTDASGRAWVYSFDATTGELKRIESPAVDGVVDVTSYSYDAQGNVTQIKTERGATTLARVDYQYDMAGNRIREWDLAGNRIDREFLSYTGLIKSETRYTAIDPDRDGTASDPDPQSALKTRYIYNGTRLRFVIDAQGAVTEFIHGDGAAANGGMDARFQVVTSRRFTGTILDVNAYPAEITYSDVLTWTADKLSQTERTDFRYDSQGRLQEKREFAQVAQSAGSGVAVGDGVLDAATAITRYSYDAQGLLRQQVTQRGAGRTLGGANQSGTAIIDYTYDGMGRLLSTLQRAEGTAAMPDPVADPSGYATWLAANDAATVLTTYAYLDSGNTLQVTTDAGMVRTEVRDAMGRTVAVTEANAAVNPTVTRTTQRHYDPAGRLVAEQDATGARRYVVYDAKGRLSATIDATGAVTQTLYDGADRVIEVRGYATRVTPQASWWDSNTPPTSLWRSDTVGTPPAGALVVTVDATRDTVTQRTYDSAGRLATETVLGADNTQTQKTTYSYDAAHRLLQASVTDGAGTAATARTTRYLYDKADRRIAEVDPRNFVTEFVYDLAGRVVKTIRYANATTSPAATDLATLRPTANATQDQTTRLFHDGRGNLVGQLDAEGYLTEFVYDEAANQRAVKAYAKQLTGLTGSETFAALKTAATTGAPTEAFRLTQRNFNALGQVTTELNHEGTVTRYSYDEAGRLVRTESAYGTSEVREGNVRYDVFGNVIGEMSGEQASKAVVQLGKALNDPSLTPAQLDAIYAQYGVRHSVDLLGRRIESIDAQGNKTWTFHDGEGRVTFVVRGQRDAANVQNARGEVTETRYDAFGRVIDSLTYTGAMTVPVPGDRNSVQAALSVLAYVAASDSRLQLSYDQRGLLTQRIDAEGYRTRYGYTAFGEVKTREDLEADGVTVRRTLTSTYDNRGQLTNAIESGGGLSRETDAVYDAFGRAITRTDARGNTVTVAYDRLGRVVSQTANNVSGRNETTSTAYDAFGRTVSVTDALGKTTSYVHSDTARSLTVTTPEGVSVTTVHNRFGQTVTVSQPLPGGTTATTTTGYDRDGNVTSVTDPLNRTTTSTYDSRGLLLRTMDATGRAVEYSYDAAGRVLTRVEDPGAGKLNLTTTMVYDGQGRQVRVTDASGRVTTMAYDRKGQLIETVQDPTGLALRTTYTWDRDGRQLTVTEGAGSAVATTTAYQYDALGRRTAEVRGSGSLNLTTTYAYDENDNVVTKTDASGKVTRFAYDAANRLRFTVDGMGGVTEVVYDAAGRATMTRRYVNAVSLGGLSAAPAESTVQALVTAVGFANDALDEVTYRVYDGDGRVRIAVDGAGGVRETVYDSAGRVLRETAYAKPLTLDTGKRDALKAGTATSSSLDLAALASANDSHVRHVYNAAGERRYSVDATGAVSGTWYDAAGRVVATRAHAQRISTALVTDAITLSQIGTATGSGASADAVTLYVYDGAGRVRYTLRSNGDASVYPQTVSVSETRYDAAGRALLTQTYLPSLTMDLALAIKLSGGTATEADLAAFTSANAGNVQSERSVYDAAGRRQYSIDGTGGYTRYRYDAAGRLVATRKAVTRLAAGTVTDATTAIQLESIVVAADADELNTYTYDAAGRLRYTTRAVGSALVRPYPATLTEVGYDGADRVLVTRTFTNHFTIDEATIQKLAAGTATDADFSAFVSANAASAQSSRTVYDAAGRATYTIDGTGGYTRYWRDAADRVVVSRRFMTRVSTVTVSDATTVGQMDAQLTWLEADEANYTIHDAAGRVRFTYNGMGQLAESTYDGVGRVLSRRGFAVPFWGDSAFNNRLYAGTATDADFATFIAANAANAQSERTVYDAGGNAIFTIDGTGAYTRRWYDGIGQQTAQVRFAIRMSLTGVGDASTVAQLDTRLTWTNENETVYQVRNASGQLRYTVQLTSPSTAAIIEAGYDGAGRTVRETRYTMSMAFDAALALKLVMGQARDADFAAFTTANLATAEIRRNAYDTAGRLRWTVDALGDLTMLTYDGAGRLLSKQTLRTPVALDAALKAKFDTGTVKDTDIVAAAGASATIAPWSTGFENKTIPGLDLAGLDPQGTGAARVENGRLVFSRRSSTGALAWTTMWGQGVYALADRMAFRAEITTDTTQTNNYLLMSLRQVAGGENEGLHIANGQLYLYRGPNGSEQMVSLGALTASTTYVVEMETSATGITTYVYAKGQTRENGFTFSRAVGSASFGNYQLLIHGRSDAGVTGSDLYVDSLAITNGNAAASESYRYDAAGKVIAKVDGLGNTETYGYDAAGRRVSVTDANGNTSRSLYDANGNLVYTIDPTGAFTRTWYDAANRAVAIRKFNARFNMATLSDATTVAQADAQLGPIGAWSAGYQHEYRVYDAAGQLRIVYDGAAYVTHREYDALGRLSMTRRYATQFFSGDTTFGNRLFDGKAGYSDFAAFITANAASARSEAQIYDNAGRLRFVLRDNAGQWQVDERQYDGAGRVVAEVAYGVAIAYAAGQSETQVIATVQAQLSADPAVLATQHRTTRFLYDSAGRQRFKLDPTFAVSEQRYDAAGRVIQTLTYAVRPSNIGIDTTTVAVWTQGVAAADTRKVSMTYDVVGRLTARTDALNNSESFTYDSAGQRLTRTDRMGATWTYQYDAAGRKVAEISPQFEVFGIDAVGNLSSTVRSLVTRYAYDGLGQLLRKTENADTGNTLVTDYVYDSRGLLTKTLLPEPGEVDPNTGDFVFNGTRPTIETTYDGLGNAVVVKDARGFYSYRIYDGFGRVQAEIDQELNVSTYLYNAHGDQVRLLRYAAPLNIAASAFTSANWQAGQEITWAQLVAGVDNGNGLNRYIHTDYDQLGRKSEVRLSWVNYVKADGTTAGGTPTTRYVYNAWSETVRESVLLEGTAGQADAVWAHTWRYFDAAGRNTVSIDAEGYATLMQYNAAGETTRKVEYARAIATGSLSLQTPPAMPAAGDATIGFDREMLWTYDVLGRKTSETAVRNYRQTNDVFAQHNQLTQYTYDNEDRVTSATDNTGTVRTTYNALGQATSVQEQARSVLVANTESLLQQNSALNLASASLYEQRSPYTTMMYNAFGWVIGVRRYANGKVGDNAPVVDNARDQLSVTRYLKSGKPGMSKDALGNVTYSAYDLAGNLTHNWSRLEGSEDARDVMVHRWYSYDKTGRQTAASQTRNWISNGGAAGIDQQEAVTYNAFGEIVAKAFGSAPYGTQIPGTLQYTYDAAGRMTADNTAGATREFGYNLAGHQTRESHKVRRNDTTLVDAVTRTVTDNLGRTVSVILPSHTDNPAVTSQVTQTFDRWGNLIRVVDARGFQTDYEYNDHNQMVKETRPLVWVVGENGVGSWQRPVTTLYHGAYGRNVGMRDANGNLSTYAYDPVGQRVTVTEALGKISRQAYDIFGNALMAQDALGHITFKRHDLNNQVVVVGDFLANGAVRTQHTLQAYTLNQNGDRIRIVDAMNQTTRQDFDSAAHLIRSQTASGVVTNYAYDVQGRKIAETNALSGVSMQVTQTGTYYDYRDNETVQFNAQTWKYDVFGRAIDHNNLSGRDYNYTYDANSGMLMSESGLGGLNAGYAEGLRTIKYYPNGRVQEVVESNGNTYRYEYDAAGNRTMEDAITYDGDNKRVRMVTRTTYDSNNRVDMVTIDQVNDQVTPNVTKRVSEIKYEYDAAGNRRHILAKSGYGANVQEVGVTPPPGSTLAPVSVTENWFTYDALNRIKINNGGLVNGQIQLRLTGVSDSYEAGYDDAGNLKVKFVLRNTNLLNAQRNIYDERGNRIYELRETAASVPEAEIGDIARRFWYDNANRVTRSEDYYQADTIFEINNFGMIPEVPEYINASGWLSAASEYTYDIDGRLQVQKEYIRKTDWSKVDQAYEYYGYGDIAESMRTTYTFDSVGRAGSYQFMQYRSNNQNVEYIHTYNVSFEGWDSYQQKSVTGSSSDNNYRTTTNTIGYDAFGRLVSQVEHTPVSGGYDDRVRYYSYNSDNMVLTRREGTIKNGVFTQPTDAGPKPNYLYAHSAGQQHAYMFEGGQSNVSGNALSYQPQRIVTTAQGGYDIGGGKVTAAAGDTLRTLATRIYGNENLWYVLADANGLGDPGAGLTAGTMLVAPDVRVSQNDAKTFKPYDPNEAIGSTTPSLPYIPHQKTGCSVLALIIRIVAVVVGAIVAYYAGPEAGYGTYAAIAGFGEMFAQTVEIYQGYRQDYNWGTVAVAALTAGSGGGGTGLVQTSSRLFNVAANAAITAAQSYVTSYAVNKLTGVEDHFSWRGLLASAAAGAVTASIFMGKAPQATDQASRQASQEAARQALRSTPFKWSEIAAQASSAIKVGLREFGKSIISSGISHVVNKAFGNDVHWDWRGVLASAAVDGAGAMAHSVMSGVAETRLRKQLAQTQSLEVGGDPSREIGEQDDVQPDGALEGASRSGVPLSQEEIDRLFHVPSGIDEVQAVDSLGIGWGVVTDDSGETEGADASAVEKSPAVREGSRRAGSKALSSEEKFYRDTEPYFELLRKNDAEVEAKAAERERMRRVFDFVDSDPDLQKARVDLWLSQQPSTLRVYEPISYIVNKEKPEVRFNILNEKLGSTDGFVLGNPDGVSFDFSDKSNWAPVRRLYELMNWKPEMDGPYSAESIGGSSLYVSPLRLSSDARVSAQSFLQYEPGKLIFSNRLQGFAETVFTAIQFDHESSIGRATFSWNAYAAVEANLGYRVEFSPKKGGQDSQGGGRGGVKMEFKPETFLAVSGAPGSAKFDFDSKPLTIGDYFGLKLNFTGFFDLLGGGGQTQKAIVASGAKPGQAPVQAGAKPKRTLFGQEWKSFDASWDPNLAVFPIRPHARITVDYNLNTRAIVRDLWSFAWNNTPDGWLPPPPQSGGGKPAPARSINKPSQQRPVTQGVVDFGSIVRRYVPQGPNAPKSVPFFVRYPLTPAKSHP